MRGAQSQILDFRQERIRHENLDPRETDPTEQEIQRLCEEIQADWSDNERQARQLWMPMNKTLVRPNQADLEYFTVPRVKIG